MTGRGERVERRAVAPDPEHPARWRDEKRPWRAFAAGFRVAWEGVVETAQRQRNMRIHLLAALLVALTGSGVAMGVAEHLALLLCVFLVIAAEVANSALESLVDLVTRDRHELARLAKDAGAAAVLVLATGSAGVLAVVLVHAWADIAASRQAVLRQALLGVPLALATAGLLFPERRSRGADLALGAVGALLLAALAAFTESAPFTGLAVLVFALAWAVAWRRDAAPDAAP